MGFYGRGSAHGKAFEFTGMAEYMEMLRKLGNPENAIKSALYAGAEILANEVYSDMEKMPTRFPYVGSNNTVRTKKKSGGKVKGLTEEQKADVLDCFGVTDAGYGRDGDWTVKIGFAPGYSGRPTKKWNNGVPVPLLAASINKGTSWLQSYPFIKRAVSRAQDRVFAAMQKEFDLALEGLTTEKTEWTTSVKNRKSHKAVKIRNKSKIREVSSRTKIYSKKPL